MNIDELRAVGLLDTSPEPHLTDKGRDWLKALEGFDDAAEAEFEDASADLILSTNGLFR